jgi:hypothetical protein
MAPGAGRFEVHDSHWSFVHENQLGTGHIAGHLTVGGAEGLHATHAVARLPTRGNYTPVASASVMRGRMQTQHDIHVNSANNVRGTSANNVRGNSSVNAGSRAEQPTWQRNGGSQSVRAYNGGSRSYTGGGAYRSTPSYHSNGPARVYRGSSSSSSHSSSSHSSGGHSGGHSGGGGHHR